MLNDSLVMFSYARADVSAVQTIARALDAEGIPVWLDADRLHAGQAWGEAIARALEDASAMVFFISPHSVASRWVTAELAAAVERGLHLVPVWLVDTPTEDIPEVLKNVQWIDAARLAPVEVAEAIARAVRALSAPPPLSAPDRGRLAQALASQSRGETSEALPPRRAVFVVHGHDLAMLDAAASACVALGVEPIVLSRIGGATTSLTDKFFQVAAEAQVAVVLLSADDLGASRLQYEAPEVAARALKFRARQNVILELGYFYGKLGWDRVLVLVKPPPAVFPDFERPSDLEGAVFNRFDEGWTEVLSDWLRGHRLI